ncbi:hypothetical protein CLERM_407 [Coxiella-like endosymbiont]|nr:hypothetical protein CLERM_407 [Coxiella-like endosymbiont]
MVLVIIEIGTNKPFILYRNSASILGIKESHFYCASQLRTLIGLFLDFGKGALIVKH